MSQPVAVPKNFVEVGVIVAPHGVSGRVKIKPYTEEAESITSYGDIFSQNGEKIDLKITGKGNKDTVLASIQNINSREKAENLVGTRLFVSREFLPSLEEGEFYQSDLVGLRAKLENGKEYGKIIGMHDYGGGDIMEIELKDSKKTEMIIFSAQTVALVNVAKGFIIINPPEAVIAKE